MPQVRGKIFRGRGLYAVRISRAGPASPTRAEKEEGRSLRRFSVLAEATIQRAEKRAVGRKLHFCGLQCFRFTHFGHWYLVDQFYGCAADGPGSIFSSWDLDGLPENEAIGRQP